MKRDLSRCLGCRLRGQRALRSEDKITICADVGVGGGGGENQPLTGATESHLQGQPIGTSTICGGKVARSHLVDVPGIANDTALQIPRPNREILGYFGRFDFARKKIAGRSLK